MSSRLISVPFLTRSCVSMNRMTAVPTAESMPSSCVPPSRVGIVFTNERRSSSVASVQVRATWQRRPDSSSSRSRTNGEARDPLVVPLLSDRVQEVGHAAVVAELDVRLVLLIDELDDQSLVEVGLYLEPLGDQGRVVAQVLEEIGVGRECDARPVPPYGLAALHGALRFAPPVALNVRLPVAADFRDQALAQGIDDAGPHAVQAARHLVGVVVKLAAGVQRGEDHLQRALARLGVDVHRDAAAVIRYGHRLAVGMHCHDDPRRVTVHHLIDGIVDDLPEEMVQSRFVDAADVHPRPPPDGLQALQHRDRFGCVGSGGHRNPFPCRKRPIDGVPET